MVNENSLFQLKRIHYVLVIIATIVGVIVSLQQLGVVDIIGSFLGKEYVIADTYSSPYFDIDRIQSKGAILQQWSKFRGSLTIRGTTELNGTSYVWGVLSGASGGYYLQYPRVTINPDGTWEVTNIQLGENISGLNFVEVTESGNDDFEYKVENEQWGKFDALPPDSEIIAYLLFSSPD